MERRCDQYSVTNCWKFRMSMRCWVDGAMSLPSIFEDRCVDLRRSMIDVSTFEDRGVNFRRSTIDVSTFEDRCADLRRWMIDVPTFENRWSLYRPSKTDDQYEIVATL